MFQQEGFQFMGAAFEVYNQLGYGMAEEVYQQSLEIELELLSIPFRTKHELAVFYKARQLSTNYKPDLIVFDCVVVELKAVAQLLAEHRSAVVQLHAHRPESCRLSRQFRPQGRTPVEAIYPDGSTAVGHERGPGARFWQLIASLLPNACIGRLRLAC